MDIEPPRHPQDGPFDRRPFEHRAHRLGAGRPGRRRKPGPIKMGIEPWLGYGQWHIAAKKGLFRQAGLDDVEIINFNTDADINAALAAGQLQAATSPRTRR